MLTSARRGISYPDPARTDRPDIPAHISNLITALEKDVIFNAGLDTDRAAATHQVGGGRVWWSTDTLTLWYDDGTAWQHIGAPLDSPTFVGTPQAPNPPAGDNDTSIATTAFVTQFFPPGVIVDYAGGSAPAGWLMCDGSAVGRTAYAGLYAIISTTYGIGDGSTTFNLPDARGRVTVGKDAGTFNVLGKKGGEETHVTIVAEMPSHAHAESAVSAGTPSGTVQANTTGLTTSTETLTHTHNIHALQPGGGATSDIGWANVTGAVALVGVTDAENQNHAHTLSAHTHVFAGSALGTHSHVISSTGGDGAHNNLQPYIALNKIIKY